MTKTKNAAAIGKTVAKDMDARAAGELLGIRPLGNRVLVRRCDAAAVSKGGIYLPEMAREKNLRAEVLAVGPGRVLDSGKRVEPSVKVGDVVYVGKYSGTEVRDGETLMVTEDDILGVEDPS